MSRDLDLFFSQPSRLFWREDNTQDSAQRYRLLDAPLTRYLIGIGRKINGAQPAPTADWDWSKSWTENKLANALPSERLLLTARAATAFLFPLTCWLLYATGRTLGGEQMGWLTFLLFASNALVLLHTRRAMAESTLLFTVSLTIFLILRSPANPYLLALATALALNAKQSTLILFFWGALALAFPGEKLIRWRLRLVNLLKYSVLFVAVVFLLNPFLWSKPFKAISAAWMARQELVEKQVETFGSAAPGQILHSPAQRLVALVANLYILPPQIAEAENYSSDTQVATQAYFSNPLHTLLRGFVGGALMAVLTVVGYLLLLRQALMKNRPDRRRAALLCAGGALQFISLLVAVPLPFQRYVVPLIPFTCLYIAFGLIQPLLTKNAGGAARRAPFQ
ncbi:MAG: hypothetical protein HPY59_10965 [Anaerolineae bacterium]|nr:hypothetical protein [Anaerolineae bacterium]